MGKHKKGNKRAPVRQPHRSLLLSSLFALSERVSGMYNATMEKLAVTFYVFLWLVLPVMVTWLPFYILFCTPIWWFVPLYATWYVYDYKTPWKGGRPFRWWQNCVIWKHFRDYFPIELVKTADLPADRNYIFGSHPHGLLSVGIFCNMVTNGNGFREKFPGLEPTVVTLDGQFRFPIRREVAIAIGGTGAARESLHWLLQHPGKGRAIAIVVGGAEEALDARPGCTRLCLLKRKGFVRMALQHRCGLVPVFHFGENDLYTQWGSEEGTRLRYVQTKIKEIVGFCPPIVSGSGLLISIGLLPRRRRVTTVIGSPISYEAPDLAFGERPSEADVDRVHGIYMAALSNLFEEHKHKYGFKNDAHLEFY